MRFLADGLRAHCPDLGEIATSRPKLFHGEVTANNIVDLGARLTLIDWQCSCIGDPAEDLAGFVSPAMQMPFGPGPVTRDPFLRFLAAYPEPDADARYSALAPLFHS